MNKKLWKLESMENKKISEKILSFPNFVGNTCSYCTLIDKTI